MNVTLTAYGRRISELVRDGFDRPRDISLNFLFQFAALTLAEFFCGENCSCPRPEIFGCEIFSADFPQIFIHIFRFNVLNLSVLVDVAE